MEQRTDDASPRFCTGCGNQISPGGNFCGRCGKKVDSNDMDSMPAVRQPEALFPSDFGIVKKRVKTCRWDFLASEAFTEKPINLFSEFGRASSRPAEDAMVDFVVTDSHFVVLKAPPASVVQKLAEKLAVNTVGAGLAGGALAMGVALLGEGYEKIFGQKNRFDSSSLAACFETGYMMFVNRSDVSCHEVLVKDGFFEPTQANVAVAGNFYHGWQGRVDMAFYFWEGAMLKSLEAAGWNIRRTGTKFQTSNASQSFAPRYLNSSQLYAKLAK